MTNSADHRLEELLRSGRDPRLASYAADGLFGGPLPGAAIACFSSCTASPMSRRGWRAAAAALGRIGAPEDRAALAAANQAVAAELVALLGLAGMAEVLLTASGTDAARLLAALLAAERPGRAACHGPSHIMVAPAETGSGMPAAAGAVAHYALRGADGALRPMERIEADVRDVCARFEHPVLHLVAGSKSGIEAPVGVPDGIEVVVDACQARLSPARIRLFLRRGWPVLLTGSKFNGGPAFSGAVLFPSRRLAAIDLERVPQAAGPADIGTLLRWAAALAEMRQFGVLTLEARLAKLASLARNIEARLHEVPHIVPLQAPVQEDGWPTTIHCFAVRDGDGRLMRMEALRSLQADLAALGVLVGQPVAVAKDFGALRIALGARLATSLEARRQIDRLFTALAARTTQIARQAPTRIAAE